MRRALRLLCYLPSARVFRFLSASMVALAAAITMGCGSNSPTPPALRGSTSVTVLLSSTANDQLSQFEINFNSLSLTSMSGNTVSLFAAGQNTEFIHSNGRAEPLLTVSIPQDVYVSATAAIGGSGFTCVALDPSSNTLVTAIYAYGITLPSQVTVNLPAPVTITGTAMGLLLDLQVSKSATYSSCIGPATYSITPTFKLTPAAFSPQLPESSLDGEISAVNAIGKSFTLVLASGQLLPTNPATANGPTLSVNTNDNTVYQGISDFSSLTVGTLVDMDAAIQVDGSQVATRISVEDTDTANLSVSTGPLLQVAGSQQTIFAFGRQNQGYLWTSELAGDFMPYSFGSAIFQISEQLPNLQSLPFVPSFNAANMFAGQNVYITSHATFESSYPTYFPATTVTLIPQTINATVNGTSTDGAFTTYDVTLAPYDLIPALASQPGQTTVVTNPSSVVVYVDSNTQLLNTQPPTTGSVMRFNGMLFNDNGTIRMDCSQVNDGVAE